MTLGKATAIAHGAATIVNAIATGAGAAFGVDLWTKAEVELTPEPHLIQAQIVSDPSENTLLIERATTRVLEHFKAETQFGAKVTTTSNIPVARGLKSSSVAANAVALATVAALRKSLDDLAVVNLGVDAAFDARVTVTGAFDDACASFFGGIVVTDNLKRRLVKHSILPEGLSVLFHVPSKKAYTGDSNVAKLQTVKPLVEVAYKETLQENYWTALSLNGLIYSAALGYDCSVAIDALNAGALAAGLCGKGPAVTTVVSPDAIDHVKTALERHAGEVITAGLNHQKAKVMTQQ